MAKVLVIRTSSFGDVVMLVPIIFSVAAKYPQDRFAVLTRKSFAPLFDNLSFNISALAFDPNGKHKGIFGLLKLISKTQTNKYSYVADLHDVLRSKIIRTSLSLLGKHVATIDKCRNQKKRMIETKQTTPAITPTTQRYMDVFHDLGFEAEMSFNHFFEYKERSLYPLRTIVSEKIKKWIGIAPFSKHAEKMYPLDKMEKILAQLSLENKYTIFLFGSGKNESSILEKWENKYPNTKNIAGKLSLINELLLMSYIDVFVSMDSANMHLASLVKIPVISIWGATHPNLGFYGFGQDPNNAIQTTIECRPCSVFGDTPCSRGDFACLTRISEDLILEKIKDVLISNNSSSLT